MWVGSLDLDKALRTNVLIAAARMIQERRIIEEANRAFTGILVQNSL
jgi:hypothetical protein